MCGTVIVTVSLVVPQGMPCPIEATVRFVSTCTRRTTACLYPYFSLLAAFPSELQAVLNPRPRHPLSHVV